MGIKDNEGVPVSLSKLAEHLISIRQIKAARKLQYAEVPPIDQFKPAMDRLLKIAEGIADDADVTVNMRSDDQRDESRHPALQRERI